MVEKLLTSGSFILTMLIVNDTVRDRKLGLTEIMYDPIFYIILISGIVIALTIDKNDPSTTDLNSFSFFFFSFFSSLLLSALAVAFKIEYQLGWFSFYSMIAITTTLSPTIVRKGAKAFPDIISDGIGSVISSFFKWGANKYTNDNKTKEDDDTV